MKSSLPSLFRLIAGFGFFAGVSPHAADAALVCSTATLSCSETISAGSQKTDFTGIEVSLDQFNPSAGQHLLSVVVSDTASFTANGTLLNSSNVQQKFQFSAGLGLDLYGGDNAPASFPDISASGAVPTMKFTLASNASTSYNYGSTFSSSSATLTNPSDLLDYIGNGTFNVDFDADASDNFVGGGNNITQNLVTMATPSVTITYNYTVDPTVTAPEPGSISLIGAALILLGTVRRRTR
jgi:hypothetical protein